MKIDKRTVIRRALTGSLAVVALLITNVTGHAAEVTPAEGRAIAKEAYIYGFPLVDNYRIQYSYFVDRKNPE